jgi:hypothetical protein
MLATRTPQNRDYSGAFHRVSGTCCGATVARPLHKYHSAAAIRHTFSSHVELVVYTPEAA